MPSRYLHLSHRREQPGVSCILLEWVIIASGVKRTPVNRRDTGFGQTPPATARIRPASKHCSWM